MIKGPTQEWYVSKNKSTLISFLGVTKDIDYDDVKRIDYSYSKKLDGGYLNFITKTNQAIRFEFSKKMNDKVRRAIEYIADNNPEIPFNEINVDDLKFYQRSWFAIVMLFFCCFPFGLFTMWYYKKLNKASRIILTVFFVGLCGYVVQTQDKVTEVTEAPTIIAQEQTKQYTQNESKEETTKSDSEDSETVFKVGDTAEYDSIKVTVLGYEESSGNDWATPDSGNIFILPQIEIENGSDDEIIISNLVSFEVYVDDYVTDFSSNAFLAISTEEGKTQLSGSIAAGKKMKGYLGIEAPAGWKKIELFYKDNIFLDSNFSFVIDK